MLDAHFIERIMLAVTEVNGCEVCTYAHTKIALEQGMDNQEIQGLLTGTTDGIPDDELKAIYFAQHYADTRGNPSIDSWNELLKTYGTERSLGILAAIRMIMAGNIYGTALSAFKSRLKGKPIKKTSISYEVKMIVSLIIFLPTSIVHGIISTLSKRPVIEYQ